MPVVWKPGPWHYGYGEVDPATQRVTSFTALPHFTGRAWQGGPALPDPVAGWSFITAQGGHAGNDLKHATIRRWVAGQVGFLALQPNFPSKCWKTLLTVNRQTPQYKKVLKRLDSPGLL